MDNGVEARFAREAHPHMGPDREESTQRAPERPRKHPEPREHQRAPESTREHPESTRDTRAPQSTREHPEHQRAPRAPESTQSQEFLDRCVLFGCKTRMRIDLQLPFSCFSDVFCCILLRFCYFSALCLAVLGCFRLPFSCFPAVFCCILLCFCCFSALCLAVLGCFPCFLLFFHAFGSLFCFFFAFLLHVCCLSAAF